MSQLTIEQIEKLLAETASGEWCTGGCSGRMITVKGGYCGDGFIADVDTEANAEFIAQSKSIVRFLLGEVEEYKKREIALCKDQQVQLDNLEIRFQAARNILKMEFSSYEYVDELIEAEVKRIKEE